MKMMIEQITLLSLLLSSRNIMYKRKRHVLKFAIAVTADTANAVIILQISTKLRSINIL